MSFSLPRLLSGLVALAMLAMAPASRPLAAQAKPTEQPSQSATPPMAAAAAIDPITFEGYLEPPQPLLRLTTAKTQTIAYTAPNPGNRRYFLRPITEPMQPIALRSRAHDILGGWQVDSRGNRSRNMTTGSSKGFELYEWETGKTTSIAIPAGARVSGATWSPDGKTLAYFALLDNATQLYLADPATGKSRQLTKTSVLATNVSNITWTSDGKSIVTVLVPDGRAPRPVFSDTVNEPMVRVNQNAKLRTRTFFSLINSWYDKALLEYYMTGQLAIVDVKSGAVKKVGTPGMIRSINPAPDARYFRVTYTLKPFSYFQETGSFGSQEVLIDATGKVLRELSKKVLKDFDSVAVTPATPPATPKPAALDTTRRNLAWHPFEPGMMFFQLSVLPAGAKADSAGNAQRKDRFMRIPNLADTNATTTVYETANRITGVRFSDNGRILFVTETVGKKTQDVAVFLDEGNKTYTIPTPPVDTAHADTTKGAAKPAAKAARVKDTPTFVTKPGSHGGTVLMLSTDGKSLFRQGMQGDSAAPRPYVEKIEIKTGTVTRLYESPVSPLRETIVTPLDDDLTRAIVHRESKTVVGQSFLLTLATKDAKQLTNNEEALPEMRSLVRKTVIAQRADGLKIRVNVTLPAGYTPGTRLPALFWFYPSEFKTPEDYTKTLKTKTDVATDTVSVNASYGAGTMAFITAMGYALVEPDAPIVAGEGELPNDTYVINLRNGLMAVIDALDTLAYIDRHRLAIGGHSYGAFSTANALIHTTFFKAGIAGDGNYNRTLTPNGFQNESRTLWQAPQTYLDMTPILHADQLTGALLMYHSTEDSNIGTAPNHAPRMFHALQGLGKTVALYMYPYEDHGQVARETVLDKWARWVAWLDKYVKHADQNPTAPVKDPPNTPVKDPATTIKVDTPAPGKP